MVLTHNLMSIENEIKQTRPFNSETEKCIVNIIYTNNVINSFQYRIVKSFGISIEQYNVLRILNGQDSNPITINEITARMLDKMSNASRLVDKLYEKGLVNRMQRANNRRACDVTITEEGRELLGRVKNQLEEMYSSSFSNKEKELIELNRLLDKFRQDVG